MEDGVSPEDAWGAIAAEAEQNTLDTNAEKVPDENFQYIDPENAGVEQADITHSSTRRQFTVEFARHAIPDYEYYEILQSLSSEQYRLHEFVSDR